jgi:hypothetical protein
VLCKLWPLQRSAVLPSCNPPPARWFAALPRPQAPHRTGLLHRCCTARHAARAQSKACLPVSRRHCQPGPPPHATWGTRALPDPRHGMFCYRGSRLLRSRLTMAGAGQFCSPGACCVKMRWICWRPNAAGGAGPTTRVGSMSWGARGGKESSVKRGTWVGRQVRQSCRRRGPCRRGKRVNKREEPPGAVVVSRMMNHTPQQKKQQSRGGRWSEAVSIRAARGSRSWRQHEPAMARGCAAAAPSPRRPRVGGAVASAVTAQQHGGLVRAQGGKRGRKGEGEEVQRVPRLKQRAAPRRNEQHALTARWRRQRRGQGPPQVPG